MSATRAFAVASAKTQTHSAPSTPSTPAVVQDVIRAPGMPLAPALRDSFERRLGHRFDNVRIHSDMRAADSARAVHARAYSVGPDIVFGAGQFAPATSGGKQLLTHELTHVIQQRGREPGPPSAAAETEADSVGRDSSSAAPVAIRAGTHPQALQRSPADDQEIDAILQAAKRAAKAKPPDVSATEPIFLMIKRYLPQWEKRVSGVSYSAKVQRVEAKASGKGRNVDVSFGREFVAAMTDARELRSLATELETAFLATNVQPDDLELSSVTTAASPAAKRSDLGITFKPDDLKEIGARDYWHAKVFSRFMLITINTTDQRLNDPEESAAVLSVLWKMQPKKFESTTTHRVSIPARAAVGKVQPKALLYEFAYMPPNKDSKKKPRVSVQFLGEGDQATLAKAVAPPSTFTPQSLGQFSIAGFPKNDIDGYWRAHPEEKLQVFHFMQNTAPNPFDQMLRVTTGTGKKQRIRDFKLSGSRDAKGNLQSVVIELLPRQVEEEAAPKTYRDKTDAGDFELETQQSKSKDALGNVDVPRDIPASESSQIKFVVASYFKKGVRNAEVDLRLAADAGEVLYTARFLAGNDVQVERIGEPRKDTQRDPDRLDIGRSREFQQLFKANDAGKLSTYIGQRYPGVTITGKTVSELRVNLNDRIKTDADAAPWFQDNYKITVLDKADGRKRMKNAHGFSNPKLAGIKDFEPAELKLVEQALEPFSLQLIGKIRQTGLSLVRQTANIGEALSGEVRTNGGKSTMRLFDGMARTTDTLFAGGRLGTMRDETQTIAHEFGHVVEATDDIRAKFNAFVKKEKLQPITPYAKKKPTKDFFTEAFSLFQTDPEWLKANQPKLFEWIETVSTTGKPPP